MILELFDFSLFWIAGDLILDWKFYDPRVFALLCINHKSCYSDSTDGLKGIGQDGNISCKTYIGT